MSNQKERLRQEVLAALRSVPMAQIAERSRRIQSNLITTKLWRDAEVVYCFVSLPREVQTATIRRQTLAEGKVLALPRVAGEDIRFHRVSDPDQPLVRSAFNIEEPPEDLPVHEPARDPTGMPTPAVLVLVPGLAFDHERYRLGRGRGYYDRFLAHYRSEVRAAGLCFEEQLVDQVPRRGWDMRMNAVVTERRLLAE
jgi:5-formyltetrahydrofolate cyclo-ligase